MTANNSETESLILRAGDGDGSALGRLLERHRQRLRRSIASRLEPRLAARIDPSDILQETLTDAVRKLPAYVRERPMPYYPWLCRLAHERLAWWRRFHLRAGKRTVAREEPRRLSPVFSDVGTAATIVDSGTSPSARAARGEEREWARAALAGLPEGDRRILEQRYFEGLSFVEIAARLELGLSAVKMRHLRALERFDRLLADTSMETGR